MSWFTNTMSSVMGRKILMSLTGLFLIIFLLTHLSGNLQLLLNDGGRSFNRYAEFMTTNPIVKLTSYILYLTFIIHIVWAIILTRNNAKARPVKYAVSHDGSSKWTSRNMGILGTIIFVFLVIHLRNFWYEMHWGAMPMVTYDGEQVKDLYTVVTATFSELWYVILYVVSMAGVMFHLLHGFKSAFQTIGANHPKYNPVIKSVGYAFAVLVPGIFAAIPVIVYLNNL